MNSKLTYHDLNYSKGKMWESCKAFKELCNKIKTEVRIFIVELSTLCSTLNEIKMTENQNQKTDSMTRDLGMLTGMFHDRESSENAYKKLLEKGYTTDEINLIMPVETRRKHFLGIIKQADFRRFTEVNVTEDSANESTTGVIAGILSSTGTKVVVRGLEIIMAGPIAVGITGSGASGIPGGIVGALVEAGFSKASAYLYEAGIKKGSIVMGVHIMDEEDARDFEPNLHAKKAQEVHH